MTDGARAGTRAVIAVASVLTLGFWLTLGGGVSGAINNPGDVRNCGDFATWEQAHEWFWTYYPEWGDVARLDADSDLIPCESLPGGPKTGTPPGTTSTTTTSTTTSTTVVPPTSTTQPPSASGGDPVTARDGYWMLSAQGRVFAFGDATDVVPDWTLSLADGERALKILGNPAGPGAWVLTSTGRIITVGGAPHYGDVRNVSAALRTAAVGNYSTFAVTPTGDGYWIFTDSGAVLAFGTAGSFGDLVTMGINPVGPVIDSAATPSGQGYYLLGSDGGVFTFGDADFYGSMGATVLNEPAVGLVPDPDGVGYWFVAADGGVFSFGARFWGSVPGVLSPGQVLNQPVNGMVPYGSGYLMVASDGGVFTFSDKPFLGSLGGSDVGSPIVAIAPLPPGGRTANPHLGNLVVAAESDGGVGYDRGSWPHWIDADGDCQNTRHEVLIVEAVAAVVMSPSVCTVTSGVWVSLFDGVTVTNPSELDVDHLVPLAEAHRSGGWAWNTQQKQDFANDLTDNHLIAVTASTNRSKGDRDPANWLPPDTSAWCRYVNAWIDVKARYQLTIDTNEHTTLQQILTTC